MFKVGDHVECLHSSEWQNECRSKDLVKAKKLGKSYFIGKAAAYMHLDEAYVVVRVSATGGLHLRGFSIQVSPNDVCISNKPVLR